MADLIERSAAIEALSIDCDRIPYYRGKQCVKDVLDTIWDRLDKLPTVDAVPVVRCKDCKHSERWYKDKRICSLWAEQGIGVFDDGFCNYGEIDGKDGNDGDLQKR